MEGEMRTGMYVYRKLLVIPSAEFLNTLVFADPQNTEARLLCADALEQLGYQAESGTWRNCYLTAALELRHGNQALVQTTVNSSSDMRNNMGAELILDYLGIALDKTTLADKDFKVNVTCTDTGQSFVLRFKNGPMLHMETAPVDDALLTFAGPKSGLLALMGGDAAVVRSVLEVTGDEELFDELCRSFTALDGAGLFNIIEP